MFRKGISGNPNGRPKGTSRQAHLASVVGDDLDEIIRSLVNKAKGGDTTAAGLILNRLVPTLKSQSLPIEIGIESTELKAQAAEILRKVSDGQLSVTEGCSLICALSSAKRAIGEETEDRILTIIGGLPRESLVTELLPFK